MKDRQIVREGDEYVCTLGYRWGVNEDDPHTHPQQIERVLQVGPTADEVELRGFLEGLAKLFETHKNARISMFYTTGLAVQVGETVEPLECLSLEHIRSVLRDAS